MMLIRVRVRVRNIGYIDGLPISSPLLLLYMWVFLHKNPLYNALLHNNKQ